MSSEVDQNNETGLGRGGRTPTRTPARGPARLVPLRSLTRPDLTFEAPRQAARRGRLAASQSSNGSWRSTQHDVETYLAIRHQRR